MWIYLVKRTLLAAIIVVIAVTLLYIMILAVPGDPLSVLLGPRSTPEMRDTLRTQMELDKPFYYQIGHYLLNVLQGDLGMDVFSNRPVSTIVFEQLSHTIILILPALAVGLGWVGYLLPTIPGDIPNLVNLPLGCTFSNRCARAFSKCRTMPPRRFEVTPAHFASCHLVTEGGAS